MRVRLAPLGLLVIATTIAGCTPVALTSCLVGVSVVGVGAPVIAARAQEKKEYQAHWSPVFAIAVSSSDTELAQDLRSLAGGPYGQSTLELLDELAAYGKSGIHADGTLDVAATMDCTTHAGFVPIEQYHVSSRVEMLSEKYAARCRQAIPRATLDAALPGIRRDLAAARALEDRREWLSLLPKLDDLQMAIRNDRTDAGAVATPAQLAQLDSLQRGLDALVAVSNDGARIVAAYHADPRVQALESDLGALQNQYALFASEESEADCLSQNAVDPRRAAAANGRSGLLANVADDLWSRIAADQAALADLARALGAMP